MSWPSTPLGEVIDLKYGKSLKSDDRVPGSHPVMGSNGKVGTHDAGFTRGRTVVVGRKGSIGKIAYSDRSCWPIDTTYFVDESSTQQDVRWLYWQLQLLGLEQMNKSAAVPGLNRDDVYRARIPLPPLPEQRRIASILDQADELRAKRRRALALLDEAQVAFFHSSFPPSDSRLFERLGDVAVTTSGGTPSRATAEHFDGGIPWVKSGEVAAGLVLTTEETISDRGLSSSSAKLMPVGTVLLAMYGATAGEVGQLGVEAATNQAVCCIEPGDMFTTDFLVEVFRARKSELKSMAVGGAQPNLSQTQIRDLKLPVPTINRQQQFARDIDKLRRLRASHSAHLNQLDDLLAALQHRAFNGKL